MPEETTVTRTRYAITHLTRDGLRVLTFANQGRNHYDDEPTALAALEAHRAGLARVLGAAVDSLQVRQVECWEHGDAVGSVLGGDPTAADEPEDQGGHD